MRKNILFALILVSSWPVVTSSQSGSEFDVKALARDIQTRYRECPRREVVGRFDRKHHKQVWQKQAWGPPTEVFVDVKPSDSILYPYILTVEFSLRPTFGPERENKADADSDTSLSETQLGVLLKGKYRTTYLVNKDGTRPKSREVLHQKLDGAPGTWEERPSWPDACWDQIGADSEQ
jgi:hypothetical protein